MNIERAFRIVNESNWGKQFIKNATEYHEDLEKFKINVAILSPKDFIKAAFIWTNTNEGYEFWEQVNEEFISAYNNKTCRVFHTTSGLLVVAKWYTHGIIANPNKFEELLKKNRIPYDGISEVHDKTTGALVYFKAYKQSSKIEEELP